MYRRVVYRLITTICGGIWGEPMAFMQAFAYNIKGLAKIAADPIPLIDA